MVTCNVCGQQMNVISWKHLRGHDMTTAEYKARYPGCIMASEEAILRKKASAAQANESRKGIARSQYVKDKIKKTRSKNPNTVWNTGVPMTEERKKHLSEVKKELYSSGQLVHWNTGRTTSDETKAKISTTALASNRTYQQSSKDRRSVTIKAKIDAGWVRANNYTLTDEHKEAWHRGGESRRLALHQEMIDRARTICVKEQLSITNVTRTPHVTFSIKCHVCETQYTRSRNAFVGSKLHQSAYLCPTCHPRMCGTSVIEQQLHDFITSIVGNKHVIANDRSVLKGREIDVYIPHLNLGFEMDGLYWHAERASGRPIHDHNTKTKLAATQGVRLIHIFEDEWVKQPEITQNRIRHMLQSQSQHTVFARRTIIRGISSKEKNEFLKQHHIQGSDISGIRYGAFYEEQLIAVMTFTTPNMSKGSSGQQYELNRFAVATGWHVPGIASRLFTRFKRDHNPTSVLSYSDRRWCTGNVYKQLGFVFEGTTPPSYWYLTDSYATRVHRSSFMKHMLGDKLDTFDPKKTEWENMIENNYDRIWDCGSTKWIWKQ